ncbi:MAG: peptidoglycan bridge formation glycyltransferase FemA/FemB family protein [Candidatus Berkelbacteria bacterium]|nr:peptidoglycan bridge formation glycyltransferase FemA/FemB family protein [Candidatus Berkelbacteria bacterium]
MEATIIAENQKEKWNQFVKQNNGTLLQSWEWGDFKKEFLWKPIRLAIIDKSQWILAANILVRRLPFSKSFIYIGEGPVFGRVSSIKNQVSGTKLLLAKMQEIAKEENAIFLRIEPFDPKLQGILEKLDFKKSFENVQPDHRLWIDLKKSEEEILKEMKHKGRYNIRIAEKRGVNIQGTNDMKMLDVFYALFLETAGRDRFSERPRSYFKKFFEVFFKNNQAKLFIAYLGQKPLVALLITYFGEYATYLYGASSSESRNTMAVYLAHWEAIKKSKQEGFKIYDFGAIAPSEESHHWSGLREFKMKFGKNQVDFPGAYDLVYKSSWYRLFKLAERVRRREG